MAESILRLKVSSEEYDNKLKRATEQLTRYADGCRKAGGTLQYVDDNVVEFARSLGRMGTTANTARGKVSELTKAYTDLAVQYKNMTDEEKKGEYGKALAASLDQLKTRIQEGKSQLDDINKSINGGGGLTGALDAVAGKFGLSIDQVTKFGGVVGVATTAVQVAKDAFFQSESGIDEWGRTVEGAKGAYSVFLDTLNNGNWSNFFQNLSAAIQGGRDLYDVFDRLGSIKSNNAAAIAITQKEIAELRLAKQQGENVDAKLKSATERLAALQKQSVSAGMAAGSQSAFQTIRNGVNSVGGAGINDATIKYAVDRIMKGGQGEFDKYKRNYEILQQKGTRTTVIPIDDGMGGTVNKYQSSFDINLLTKEQQKQYALAKAITEGETRIQKGIAAYAQAVSEGTSAAREEFKGNRYALQGAGGSGGRSGGGGGGKTTTDPAYAAGSLAEAQAEVQRLSKLWNEAGADVRDQYLQPLIEAEAKVKSMQNAMSLQKEQAQGRLLEDKPAEIPVTASISDSFIQSVDDIREYMKDHPIVIPIENTSKDVKALQDTAKTTAQVVGTIGQAFNAIEDPAAKVAAVVAQAIANIALAYSDSLAKDQPTKSNIYAFIAAAAAATVSMVSTIASIHQATGYARGGVIKAANGAAIPGTFTVPGTTYSNDQIPAMLNAGETVLTRAQAGNIASQLQGAGGNINLNGVLTGENIYIAADRYARRSGRGELVTFHR